MNREEREAFVNRGEKICSHDVLGSDGWDLCTNPVTVCRDSSYYCDEHDPLNPTNIKNSKDKENKAMINIAERIRTDPNAFKEFVELVYKIKHKLYM